jgi:hypothetical protein
MLYGPNTNNGSILTMIEAQVDYSLRKIEQIAAEDLAWIDVKPEPQAAYNEKVQKAIAAIPVWNHEVNGYYRSPSGRVVTQWPFSMSEFERQTTTPDAHAYETASR